MVDPKREALLLLARLIVKKHTSTQQTIGNGDLPNNRLRTMGNNQTLTDDLRNDPSRQEET